MEQQQSRKIATVQTLAATIVAAAAAEHKIAAVAAATIAGVAGAAEISISNSSISRTEK